MKRFTERLFLLTLSAVLILSSCSNRVEGSVNGASAGSIVGGLIGSIFGGHRGEDIGSLAGIVAGGAVGYAIGSSSEKNTRQRWTSDEDPVVIPRKEGVNTRASAEEDISIVMRTREEKQPRVIAHRGEWRTDGSAQNSRTSLRRALDLGIWGTEIDVWLTRDGHVMVNHDATYQGVSLQDTTFKACKRLRLSNGEKMPELKELLKIMQKSDSPTLLVLEVKSHRDPERSRACARAAVEAVNAAGLQDRTVYISFSIDACQTILQVQKDAEVAYLNGDRAPHELYPMGINGIDYHISHLRQHPEWVDEAHRLGMSVNVWTVDKPDEIREMQRLGVDFITTNVPEVCEQLVRNP